IDLLREGETIVRVTKNKLERLRPWDYLVVVSRQRPPQQEVYSFRLESRLPRVAIPLANEDPDVVLNLQTSFDRCWDEGPYPGVSNYDQKPPGELANDRIVWCQERLKASGYLKS
ncbi:MAG: DUF4058 family protein, partial [Planctomycetes bacterium]|nr:DUF4058 family protein [Planctomycetota bacterium]